ncbi:MAG: PAS domain S-box protein, partial [Chloroflexi bacterium]|nr:PAS domain S-box protein [Chloroflexota bacterium]
DQLGGLLEGVPEAAYYLDHQWQLRYANRIGKELWERLGNGGSCVSLWEVFSDLAGTNVETKLHETMTTGNAAHIEHFFASLNAWLELTARPSLDGLFLYAQDVTPRKQTERHLVLQNVVSEVLASPGNLSDVTSSFLQAVGEGLGWDWSAVWFVDEQAGSLRCNTFWRRPWVASEEFESSKMRNRYAPGEGLPGRVWSGGRPIWIPDILADAGFPRAQAIAKVGLRSAFAFPITNGGKTLGVVELFSRQARPPDENLLRVATTLGRQIGQFVQRRLAEETVRESEARKTALLESALDAIIAIDSEGKIIEFNPAAEKTFGWGRDQVLGRDMSETIIPPFLRGDHRKGLERYVQTGEAHIIGKRRRLMAVRAGGEEFPVEITVTRIPLDGPPMFTAVIRDITEQLEIETALRQQEEQFRQLAETIRSVFWMTDPEKTEMIYVSPAYEDIWGLSRRSLYASPQTWVDAIHPEDRDRVRLAAQTKQTTGEYDEVYRITRPDRTFRWIRDRAFPVRDEQGKVYRVAGIAEDITQLKQAEDALRASEQQYRTLVELVPDVIYSVAEDGTIIALNPAFERVTGWPASEWVGKHFAGLLHQDDLRVALENFKAVMRGKSPPPFELRLLCKDGTYLVGEFWSTPGIEKGQVVAHVGSARDVTARKRLEEQLIQKARELAVLEERNRFAQEIHDTLAQGFTGILLQLEAARKILGSNPGQSLEHIGRAKSLAQESLQEARRSVWNLLPQALEKDSFEEAVKQAVRRFGEVGPEEVSFGLSGEQRELAPEVQMTLLRICQEALANARRHAKATKVSVNLVYSQRTLRLTVQDNGVGFDVQVAQQEGDAKRRGLSILAERTRLLKGKFRIQSQKGKGTVVTVTIPIQPLAEGNRQPVRPLLEHPQRRETAGESVTT